MKKAFLGIFLAAFVAVGSFAQDQDPGFNKKHHGQQDVMEQLNLTDNQKTELKAIREDYHQQMADLKKNEDITVREWKTKMETIRKDHRDKMQNLLTDDQKASMKKMMADRKGDRKKHFFGHHGGRKGHHGQRLEKMKKELGLTDDQVTALKKNREETFPMSIFAGSVPGKKSLAKRNARRERTPRSAIRSSAKWKCAEARKRQSVSIF